MAEPLPGDAGAAVDEAEARAQQGLLEGITAVSEVDVLCGRGGAALRHPGNQTYRRLVNLNKGLYITCLKTEKLKISRSIVAAIREQKGRFLEKDNKNGSWFDIGDKKAIEKTSQALREGQPKLRQKIVEMGGGAAGAVSLMESNFGPTAATLFADPEYVSISNSNGGAMLDGSNMNNLTNNNSNMPPPQQDMAAMAAALRSMQPSQHQQLHNPQHRHQQQQQQQQQHLQHPGQPGLLAVDDFLQHAESLQNLSLHDMSETQQRSSSQQRQQQQQQQQQQQYNVNHNNTHSFRQRILRPSLTGRVGVPQELGMQMQHQDSQLSLMSEFSSFGHSGHNLHSNMGGGGGGTNESLLSLGMNNDSYRGGGGGGGGQHRGSLTMMHASAQPSSTSSNMAPPHNPGELFSEDQGSAVNSRQGIPNHYQQQQQFSMASSGGHGRDNINSLRKSDSTAPTSNRTSDDYAAAEDLDRRRVFAKMKYSRPPSDRSQHNSSSAHRPPSQQQSQHQQYQHQQNLPQASQHSLGDGMPDIYMVESSLSLHSNLSIMTDGKSQMHLGSSSHHNMGLGGSNHHMTGSSSHMPGAGTGGGGSNSNQAAAAAQLPAGVEVGKVVDHSSRGMDSGSYHNHFPDMLGSGSKHSIMSGLSRISDTSLNEGGGSSIFSDLSRKIGNVSTRSMAMSEISGIDLMREREDEDNYDDDDDDDDGDVDDDDDDDDQDFAGEN